MSRKLGRELGWGWMDNSHVAPVRWLIDSSIHGDEYPSKLAQDCAHPKVGMKVRPISFRL